MYTLESVIAESKKLYGVDIKIKDNTVFVDSKVGSEGLLCKATKGELSFTAVRKHTEQEKIDSIFDICEKVYSFRSGK